MRTRSAVLLVVAVVAAASCGDDVAPEDASIDASMDAGATVEPPGVPWLDASPFAWTCPAGWREVEVGGRGECDPYPESGPEGCGAGEAHFPGEPGCRPIGDPCPAGELPEGLPEDGPVIYVTPTAAPGGDGTMASPYDSLGDISWPSLSAGSTVALGKGTYEATLPLDAGVRVVGACAAETILTGVDFPAPAVVSVTTAGEPAEVRSLTIDAPPQRAVSIDAGRRLRVAGVEIVGAQEHGIFVFGAGTAVELEDVVIRGTRPRPGSGSGGRGIQVGSGAEVAATRVILSANRDAAVIVGVDGARASLTDAVIRDTEAQLLDGAGGRGITIQQGGAVAAERLLVTGNRDIGIVLSGEESTLSLSETIVRGTRPREADDTLGRGVEIQSGTLTADTVVIADNRVTGLYLSDGARATVDRAVVRDTVESARDGLGGRGINVQSGAALEARDVVVADCRELGIFASDPGTEVRVEDALVSRIEARATDDAGGRGIGLQSGARLDAARTVVTESRDLGIYVSDEGTDASLSDVVVRDVRARLDAAISGRGVQVQGGATLSATRLEVLRVRESGVMSVTGATASLEDLLVSDVLRAACAETTCTAQPFGYGITVGSARLVATRFRIERAATCGVFIAPDVGLEGTPAIELTSGVVTESTIGACVQVDDFDLSSLTDGVRYTGNENNLESTMLPVPEPVDSVESP